MMYGGHGILFEWELEDIHLLSGSLPHSLSDYFLFCKDSLWTIN